MGRRLLVLSLILFVKTTGVITQQEVCSVSGVRADTKQVSFGGQAQFQCEVGGDGRLWWESRDCDPGSFVRSDRADCNDGDLMCVVPVEVYRDGYFYFCCTPMDAGSVADANPLHCFQLQVCTEVSKEEYPPNVLPGTVGVIRIDVVGHPQPNGSLVQPAGQNVVRSGSIPNTYTNFSFVISLVVPDTQRPELDFEVHFTTPEGCQPQDVTGYANVIQNSGELLEGLDVCPTAEPTVTPSPPDSPEECECFITHRWVAAPFGVGLVITTVIATLSISYCICELKKSPRFSLSSSPSASESYTTDPYEMTPGASSPNGGAINGQHVYSTISNYGVPNGQPQGVVTASRPSQLWLHSTEQTPEDTPATSATSATQLYPHPQYYFRDGLPADGSAIPSLREQPPGTDV